MNSQKSTKLKKSQNISGGPSGSEEREICYAELVHQNMSENKASHKIHDNFGRTAGFASRK